ncbi:MarR family transcriptional regulator [Cytophaga sp. FL35]|uniref:MarR family winged helix-turn-helix transcriptional regulator n=1 Tax=Cytophaga sp. FL35 TaxID=1904456 RepID=UPI00165398A8|nr:MarR family transcriptional regulator [Cytophaga sp. FL35]MBC6999568.1 MarR family transcriptional regulator [Cytophaga sp. FL35]
MNVEQIIKTEKEIPLASRTIIHLSLVMNKISEIVSSALKPFEMSPEQFNVLRILRGQKNQPANLSTLNERMVHKMSNTTRLVDKLIKKGYVHRTVCPSNRRKVEIRITDEGKSILKDLDQAMALAEEEILKNFDVKELKELNTLLNKF